jgi:Flp pilus assembly protein TadG
LSVKRIRRGIFSRLRAFRSDRRGVAAVEFSLILPVMLTIYLGGVEVGDGFAIDTRVTLVTRSVTDLTTQYITIDNQDMSNILGASTEIVTPYSAANITVTVSEVTTDSSGNGTITWSDSLNGTARVVGSKITLPTSLKIPNISVILGEVSYAYAPALGYVMTGTITMSDSFYMMPRLANSVTRVNS